MAHAARNTPAYTTRGFSLGSLPMHMANPTAIMSRKPMMKGLRLPTLSEK
jgi:hypothetical protein